MSVDQVFPSKAAGPFGRQQRHARGARTPVTVVTGFLGAGKTTLLRAFLKTPEGKGTAVVVNEFGATGIDDALVRESADKAVLLGNGCLCCITRTDLQVTLRKMLIERERGQIPSFQRVVIETSGMADPSPILQTFATDRALGEVFHLETMLTVVDAATGLETLEWSTEARKQAILADRMVITKGDIVSPEKIERLKAQLRTLNAGAGIREAIYGKLDPDAFLESGSNSRNAFVAEAEHSDGITSFVITENVPMPWPVFARVMDVLTTMRGRDLLRVKGFLNVEGCRGPVVVQFVQHLSHPPSELENWPDNDRRSRVVFITRDLSEAQVRTLFVAVRALLPMEPGPGP